MPLRDNPLSLFPPLLAALVLAGCAGQSIPYESVAPRLEYSGRRTVVVAVRDGRAQMADGQRDPSLVGEALVGGARKAPIAIGSGAPLARVVGEALVAALEAGGFAPSLLTSDPGESRDQLARRALESTTDYLWLFDVEDWWTARHKRTTHTYKLAFAVLGPDGDPLVERSFEGTVRWDEDGSREGGPDQPEETAKRDPVTVPETGAGPPDPDAFEQAASAPDGETAAETPPADPDPAGDTPAPAVRAAGDPVADYLMFLLTDLIEQMINDPDVPRKMVRFT